MALLSGQTGRTLAKGLAYLFLGGALVFAYASYNPEAFVKVPEEREPSLIGDWYVHRFGSFRKYSFRENGKGEIISPGRPNREFFWGTEDGTLRLKYVANNGWTAPLYKISQTDTPAKVDLESIEGGYPIQLQREPPESAILK